MDDRLEDFRNASVILRARPAFAEVEQVLHGCDRSAILAKHLDLTERRASEGKRPNAGGQAAINALLRDRFDAVGGWTAESHLFAGRELSAWKMDFRKAGIGIEVSFNHSEAIPWQFTRLNIAGESARVIADNRIDVGIVVCADMSLKRWARMDNAVGTYPQFKAWLREMRPILPVPILLIGLLAEGWPDADSFRGTDQGTRTRQ